MDSSMDDEEFQKEVNELMKWTEEARNKMTTKDTTIDLRQQLAAQQALLEEVRHRKARVQQLVIQNPEASHRKVIHDGRSSSLEPTLTPAGHLMSEMSLLERSAQEQHETLELALTQLDRFQTEQLYLARLLDTAQRSLEASPQEALTVGALKQQVADRNKLTEQIKCVQVRLSQLQEKCHQLMLDSAQLSPSLFRKHYHPESAYWHYFAARANLQKGGQPALASGQLFYQQLPTFQLDPEFWSLLPLQTQDSLDLQPWENLESAQSTPVTPDISFDLPRKIPPPRTDSIPRPTWSGNLLLASGSPSEPAIEASLAQSAGGALSSAQMFETSAATPRFLDTELASARQTDQQLVSCTRAETGPHISTTSDVHSRLNSLDLVVPSTSIGLQDLPDTLTTGLDVRLHQGSVATEVITRQQLMGESHIPGNLEDKEQDASLANSESVDRAVEEAKAVIQLKSQELSSATELSQHTIPLLSQNEVTELSQHSIPALSQNVLTEINQHSMTALSQNAETELNDHLMLPLGQNAETELNKHFMLAQGAVGAVEKEKLIGVETQPEQKVTKSPGTDSLQHQEVQNYLSSQLALISQLKEQLATSKNTGSVAETQNILRQLADLERELSQAKLAGEGEQLQLLAAIRQAQENQSEELQLNSSAEAFENKEIHFLPDPYKTSMEISPVNPDSIREGWESLSKELWSGNENLESFITTRQPGDTGKVNLSALVKYKECATELDRVKAEVRRWTNDSDLVDGKSLSSGEEGEFQLQAQSLISDIGGWLNRAEHQLLTLPLTPEQQIEHNQDMQRNIKSLQKPLAELKELTDKLLQSREAQNKDLAGQCLDSVSSRMHLLGRVADMQDHDLQEAAHQWQQYQILSEGLQEEMWELQGLVMTPSAGRLLDQIMSDQQKIDLQLESLEDKCQELQLLEAKLTRGHPKGAVHSKLAFFQNQWLYLHKNAVDNKTSLQKTVLVQKEYQQMLQECEAFLEMIQDKVQIAPVSVQNLNSLQQLLAAHQEWIHDLEAHRSMLDNLASQSSGRQEFQQQHWDLANRLQVLLDKACIQGHKLERQCQDWTELDKNSSCLQQALLSLEAQLLVPSTGADSCQTQLIKYQQLKSELASKGEMVHNLLEQGKQLLLNLNCPALETSINKLADQWLSLNLHLSHQLHKLETTGTLMSSFEAEAAVLSAWLMTAKMKLSDLQSLPSSYLMNVAVVRTEMDRVLEFHKELENQLALKTRVVSLGQQLKQSGGRGDLAQRLGQYEEEWQQLYQGVLEVEQYLAGVQMELMPSRQTLAELSTWAENMIQVLRKEDAHFIKMDAEVVKKYKGFRIELASQQMLLDFVNQQVLAPQPEELDVAQEKLEFASKLKELNKKWGTVREKTMGRLQELEHAQIKMEEFDKSAGELEAWFDEQDNTMKDILASCDIGVKFKQKECQSLQEQLDLMRLDLVSVNALGNYCQELSQGCPSLQHRITQTLYSLEIKHSRLGGQAQRMQEKLTDLSGLWSTYNSSLNDLNQILTEADSTLHHYKLIRGDTGTLKSQLVKLKTVHKELAHNSDLLTRFTSSAAHLQQVCGPTVRADIQRAVSDIQAKWFLLDNGLTTRVRELDQQLVEWQHFEDKLNKVEAILQQSESGCSYLASPACLQAPGVLAKSQQLQQELDNLHMQYHDLLSAGKALTRDMTPSATAALMSRLVALEHKILAIKRMLSQLTSSITNNLDKLEQFQEAFKAVRKFLTHVEVILSQTQPSESEELSVVDTRLNQIKGLLSMYSSRLRHLDDLNDLGYRLALDDSDATCLKELNHQWYALYEQCKERSSSLQSLLLKQKDFSSRYQTFRDYLTSAEEVLTEKMTGNMDHFRSLLCRLEQVQCDLDIQKQILLSELAKNDSKTGDGQDQQVFQRKLRLLSGQWEQVAGRLAQRHSQVETVTRQWHLFQKDCQQLQKWLHNQMDNVKPKSAYLHTIPLLVDQMKHLKSELKSHERTLTSVQELAGYLLSHADIAASAEIKDTVTDIQQDWSRLLKFLEDETFHLEEIHRKQQYYEQGVDIMTSRIQYIRRSLKSDLTPTGDSLAAELVRCREMSQKCSELEQQEGSLQETLSSLDQVLTPGEVSQLQHNVNLLRRQREDLLQLAGQREADLTQALYKWSEFEESLQSFIAWIDDVTIKVVSSQAVPVEDLLARLEQEYIPAINSNESKMASLEEQGKQLIQIMKGVSSSAIGLHLGNLVQKWNFLKEAAGKRLRKLQETALAVKELNTKMRMLIQRLASVEARLNEGLGFDSKSPAQLEVELQDCKNLQQALDHQAAGVKAALDLCQVLLLDSDACPTHAERLALQQARQKLQGSWESVTRALPQTQTRIEERRQLIKSFQESCDKLSEWISDTEDKLAISSTELSAGQAARVPIQKYEIMATQQNSSSIQADFDTTRTSLTSWLGQVSAQLQQLGGHSRLDLQTRTVDIKHLKDDVQTKRHRMEYLEQAGLYLMQKGNTHQVQQVQNQLEEFRTLKRVVLDKLAAVNLDIERQILTETENKHYLLLESSARELSTTRASRTALESKKLDFSPLLTKSLLVTRSEDSGLGTSTSTSRLADSYCQDLTAPLVASPWRSRSPTDRLISPTKSSTQRLKSPIRSQASMGESTSRNRSQVPLARDVSNGSRKSRLDFCNLEKSAKVDILMEMLAESLEDCQGRLSELEIQLRLGADHRQTGQLLFECEVLVDDIKRLDRLLTTETDHVSIISLDGQVKFCLRRWQHIQEQARQVASPALQPKGADSSQNRQPKVSHQNSSHKKQLVRLQDDVESMLVWLQQGQKLRSASTGPSLDPELDKQFQEVLVQLDARKPLVESINETSSSLLGHKSDQSQQLKSKLREMNQKWNKLLAWADSLQKQRSVSQCQPFLRAVDDIQMWIEKQETAVRHCEPVRLDADPKKLIETRANLKEIYKDLMLHKTKVVTLQGTADRLLLTNCLLPELSAAWDKMFIVQSRLHSLLHTISAYLSSLDAEQHPRKRLSAGCPAPIPSRSSLMAAGKPSYQSPYSSPHCSRGHKLETESKIVIRPAGPALWWRVVRAALPLYLLCLLLLWLVPACSEEQNCPASNRLPHSFTPSLRYTDGAPPT